MIEYGIKIDLLDGVSGLLGDIASGFKGLGGIVKTTRSQIDELRKTSSETKDYKKLELSLKKVSKQINTQREYVDKLNKELAESDGLSAAQMRRKQIQIDKATVALNKLEDKQTDYNRQLKETGSSLQRAGVNTQDLASEQRRLNQEIQQTTQKLARQKGRWSIFGKVSNDLKNVRSEMTGIVSSVVGVAGMGMSLKATLEPALGFEVAMDKVQALTRLDLGQSIHLALFNDLEKQALSLGRATAFSASQVADAQGFLAMAGFDAKKIVTAIPGILDLSKAASVELAVTADIGSNILSGFRLEADQMDRVGDVLAATFSRSNVDLRMLGESMKYAAPIAAELNIGLEETAAMAGLLGNVGIQGSEAGTALRALYNRMAAPPKAAKDSLEALDIKTQDANGNMRSTSTILGELAKKTEKMGSATRLGHFKAIAGMEAGSAMATLVAEQGAKGISKFVEILKDSEGESSRIAKIMGDNTQGLLTGLSSRVEGLAISVGKVLKPEIDPLIKDINELVTSMTDWVDANPELAGSFVKVALGISGLVAGIATLGAIVGLAKIAFLGIGAMVALIVSPIALVIGGLAALAGAWYFWEDIMSWLEGSFPQVHDFFAFDLPESIDIAVIALGEILPFGDLIGSVFDRISKDGLSWKSVFGGIMDWFKKKMDWLRKSLKWIEKGLAKLSFGGGDDEELLGVDLNKTVDIGGEVTHQFPPRNDEPLDFDSIDRSVIEGYKDPWPKIEVDNATDIGGDINGTFGGQRATGGPVTAGSFYQVNELGPELLTMGGKTFLMANAPGTVIPLQQPKNTIPSMRAQQQTINTQHQSTGRLDIHIDSPVPTRVKRMEAEGMEISVNTGPMGVFSA